MTDLEHEADAYARKHSGLGPRDPRYGRYHRAYLAGARRGVELSAERCFTGIIGSRSPDSPEESIEWGTRESCRKAIKALLPQREGEGGL